MKKNTHRPGLTKSANLPACADSGGHTTTGDNNGSPVWMAVGGEKAHAFEQGHLGPLPFLIDGICELGPDMAKCVGEKIAPGHRSLCESLDSSTVHNGHRAFAGDPLRDHGRLDPKVFSEPNTATSYGIEPFNKFVHSSIIRPSLMNCNRYCLKGCDS